MPLSLPHKTPSPIEPPYTREELLPLSIEKSSTPNLHHLVVATKSKPGLDLLLYSARRGGYATHILGAADARPIGHHTTPLCMFDCPTAFGLKLILVKEAVAALPPRDWVLFTDAYDVIFSRPAPELLAALEAWEASAPAGVDLLFGAEKFEWPDGNLPGYAARGPAPYPFLNSGVYAGRAAAVLASVSDGYDLSTDDQRFFTEKFVGSHAKPRGSASSRIALDENQNIFANFAGTNGDVDWFVDHSRILFGSARTAPIVLHFNSGLGKRHMLKVAAAALGPAGAALADVAQYDGNEIRELFLNPAKNILLSFLPYMVRAALSAAHLGDAAAFSVALALVLALFSLSGCSARWLRARRSDPEKWAA
jgi:hypothetical protein